MPDSLLFLPDLLPISIKFDAKYGESRPGGNRKMNDIGCMKRRRLMIALLALALALITLILFILTEYYLQPH